MKRIFAVLTAILLVTSMLMSLTSCGSSDGSDEAKPFTTAEVETTESVTPVGNTSEEVLAYFNSLVNGLKTERPAISYRYEKNVPDDSIKITKAGQEDAEEIDKSLASMNDAAVGVKDMILEDIKEISGELAFGADNTEYLFKKGEPWTSALTVTDIDYATIKEVGEFYYITIVFDDVESNGDTAALAKAFDLRDKDAILASDEFAKVNSYLKFTDNGYDVSYSGCKITATVNRLTDEITNLNYYKSAVVTAHMTGVGTLESYGDISVIFTLEDKSDFNMTWTTELPTSPLETAEETTKA